MLGHSGARAFWTHPILGWVMRPFGMDLVVEDHDLHHRFVSFPFFLTRPSALLTESDVSIQGKGGKEVGLFGNYGKRMLDSSSFSYS